MLNAFFFLLIAFCVSGLILSDRIKDGIIIKSGLILVAIGFVGASSAVLDTPLNYLPAVRMIGIGICVCMLGLFVRGRVTQDKCRRVSDWLENESTTRL